MIVARTIRADEADEFLAVLCEIFELDYPRARPVFFSEPFYDLSRKWALFVEGRIVSVLTTVPLQFGWGLASGYAGVGTLGEYRRKGFGERLLQAALDHGTGQGEVAAFLFARQTHLYERLGFEVLDSIIRAPLQSGAYYEDDPLTYDEVRELYTKWSNEHPGRLRRDDQRWSFWKWHLRMCDRCGSGYLCREPGTVREAVPGAKPWPIGQNEEFYGLQTMAEQLDLPVLTPKIEMHLMGLRAPGVPQIFMTDQF